MNWLVAILAVWTVVKVSDGDTVWVKDGGERVKVRLDKIDAPESDQKWGKESKEALSAMVLGREVELVGEGTDRYGRRLSVIKCEGKEVNLELVKMGLAWHYAYHDKTPAPRSPKCRSSREDPSPPSCLPPFRPASTRKARACPYLRPSPRIPLKELKHRSIAKQEIPVK